MRFFDKLANTYAAGYKEKRAESRAQEDAERDTRMKMYETTLADDTLTDTERHHILNQMGDDTGYKHDPKVFGFIHPHQPGHKGMSLGDAIYGMTLEQHRRTAGTEDAGGMAGGVRTNPAPVGSMMSPTAEMPGAQPFDFQDGWDERLPSGETVYEAAGRISGGAGRSSGQASQLPPPPAPPAATPGPNLGPRASFSGAVMADGARGSNGLGADVNLSRLPPPPSSDANVDANANANEQYPPGYAPDRSTRAGRREALRVRGAWAEHQGQADLIKEEYRARGFTEKLAPYVDGEEFVQPYFNPATGETKEFRSKGMPVGVVTAQVRATALADRKVQAEIAILKRLPENAGKSDEELQHLAAHTLTERQGVVDQIKQGTLKWQGGDLTKLVEAHKTLSDKGATADEKEGARQYINFRNAALEANRARAQYFATAGTREDERADRRDASQAIGQFNSVRTKMSSANAEAKMFEEQAGAKDAEARAFESSVRTKAKAPTARAEAAALRARAAAAKERADALREDLIGAGANAEAFPRHVQVTWGEDGLPSIKRIQRPAPAGGDGGGAGLPSPPSARPGRYAGQRMPRANLAAAAKALGYGEGPEAEKKAEATIKAEGGVIY